MRGGEEGKGLLLLDEIGRTVWLHGTACRQGKHRCWISCGVGGRSVGVCTYFKQKKNR